MKISNSKKQLAKIISENGGWRDEAESAAQCSNGEVSFWHDTATKQPGEDWCGSYLGACDDIEFTGIKLPNWHQTILSRDEYFHLYPSPDADGWIEWGGGECPVNFGEAIDVKYRDGHLQVGCKAMDRCCYELYATTHWGSSGGAADIIAYRLHKPEQSKPEFCESVMRSIPEPEAKQTIEQLAADYRNAKDYADRKQQEADAAKADAEAKLVELVAAGKAIGLVLSIAGVAPELVITDWRDLREGDIIELTAGGRYLKTECTVVYVPGVGLRAKSADDTENQWWNLGGPQEYEWRLIRRPAKGDTNA